MYTVKFHNCHISGPAEPAVSYQVIASVDQIVAGALVKSQQLLELRGQQWIVVISDQDNRTVHDLVVCDGDITS